jgi:hypothetical protein
MNEQQLAAVKQALEALEIVRPLENPEPAVEEAIAALQSIISQDALDKMADNARELGLDYEPAVQEVRLWAVFCGGCRKEWSVPYQHPGKSICAECEAKCKDTPPAAQPALPPMHASGLVAIKTLLSRDPFAHAKVAIEMIDAMLAAEPQPVPVKTYHDGKPWPVAPKPWVGLTDEELATEATEHEQAHGFIQGAQWAEAKLKEKNHA